MFLFPMGSRGTDLSSILTLQAGSFQSQRVAMTLHAREPCKAIRPEGLNTKIIFTAHSIRTRAPLCDRRTRSPYSTALDSYCVQK